MFFYDKNNKKGHTQRTINLAKKSSDYEKDIIGFFHIFFFFFQS